MAGLERAPPAFLAKAEEAWRVGAAAPDPPVRPGRMRGRTHPRARAVRLELAVLVARPALAVEAVRRGVVGVAEKAGAPVWGAASAARAVAPVWAAASAARAAAAGAATATAISIVQKACAAAPTATMETPTSSPRRRRTFRRS